MENLNLEMWLCRRWILDEIFVRMGKVWFHFG